MADRPPIDYTPQFRGGLFRPREVVEQELAALDEPPAERPANRPGGRPAGRTPVRSAARTSGRVSPSPAPQTDRSRVRHSFDIFQDQLLDLVDIQAEVFRETGRKPKIGELVQAAIDAYIEAVRGPAG